MTVVALPLWNEALIQKYNLNGPRYTSYPTALKFTDQVTSMNFIGRLATGAIWMCPYRCICISPSVATSAITAAVTRL